MRWSDAKWVATMWCVAACGGRTALSGGEESREASGGAAVSGGGPAHGGSDAGGTGGSGGGGGAGGEGDPCLACGCWEDVPEPTDQDEVAVILFDQEFSASSSESGSVQDGYLFAGTQYNQIYAAGVSFDLSRLREEAEIITARLFIKQYDSPWDDSFFATGGYIGVTHVRFAHLSSLWSAEPFPTLNAEALAGVDANVWRELDVTLAVRYQLADCEQRVQLRMDALPYPPGGLVGFIGDAHDGLYDATPYIEVRFR